MRFAGERLAADRRDTRRLAERLGTTAPSGIAASLLASLAFAFFGGLLLNLMPCVFPVLSLKVLGFASHGQDRRQLVAGGLAYTFGVVLSFVALAGAAARVSRRRRPARLGIPAAVAALRRRPVGPVRADRPEPPRRVRGSRASCRAVSRPRMHATRSLDHGLTGVLAVAVASPCTDAVHGRRARRRAHPTGAAGAERLRGVGRRHGRAVPGRQPVARTRPLAAPAGPLDGPLQDRDGLSDVRHRRLAGVGARPAGGHRRCGGAAGADPCHRLLALAALVQPAAAGQRRTAVAAAAAVIVATAAAWLWGALQPDATAGPRPLPAPDSRAGPGSPGRPARLAKARAEGRPVFVDFTAAWCLTCQINKRATLGDEDVMQAFRAKDVLLLRADWTRRDPLDHRGLAPARPQRRARLRLLRARARRAAAAFRDPDRVRSSSRHGGMAWRRPPLPIPGPISPVYPDFTRSKR